VDVIRGDFVRFTDTKIQGGGAIVSAKSIGKRVKFTYFDGAEMCPALLFTCREPHGWS